MADVQKDKKSMWVMVIKILDEDAGAQKDFLISSLAIEFRYGHDLIKTLLSDMVNTGSILIDEDDFITLTKFGKSKLKK